MHASAVPLSSPAPQSLPLYREWLYRYAAFCAGSVLFLICLGGVVTSRDAGMAVPDWPTSYGYNMFLFPWDLMTGGIFWEHSHRLVASGVGTLILGLAIALCYQERIWLRWLGLVAALIVTLQGVLGGLRVTEMNQSIGIFHGCLAQALFVLVAFIALALTRWWIEAQPSAIPTRLRWIRWTGTVTALIFLQLTIGATMRHQHAGLAINDFPLAYGHVWPQANPAAVAHYNEERLAHHLPPTTGPQIHLQMLHRLIAVLLVGLIVTAVWKILAQAETPVLLRRWAWTWGVLIFLQFSLGAATIWTNKAADVATTHVAVGALTLLTGALLTAMAYRINGVNSPTAS